MEATTATHLTELTNSPAFHAWQAAKAARENRARTVTNLLAAAACVLLVVTMALLKPAATGGAAAVVQQVRGAFACLLWGSVWLGVICAPIVLHGGLLHLSLTRHVSPRLHCCWPLLGQGGHLMLSYALQLALPAPVHAEPHGTPAPHY